VTAMEVSWSSGAFARGAIPRHLLQLDLEGHPHQGRDPGGPARERILVLDPPANCERQLQRHAVAEPVTRRFRTSIDGSCPFSTLEYMARLRSPFKVHPRCKACTLTVKCTKSFSGNLAKMKSAPIVSAEGCTLPFFGIIRAMPATAPLRLCFSSDERPICRWHRDGNDPF
jgi:hypothetical protein